MILPNAQSAQYLARLGLPHDSPEPSEDWLRELQVRHLERIPFENLDIHLGVPIRLGHRDSVAKIVSGRGGFCYELNGAFAALLSSLGFDVDLLEARVEGGKSPSIPFDHLCVRAQLDGHPWLVDVGFGACFAHPLPLRLAEPLSDPSGTFRIDRWSADRDWLELTQDEQHVYRFHPSPRTLTDFTPGCQHHQTSKTSHFTHNPVCTRRTSQGGRVTLRGSTLIETLPDGARTETQIDDASLLDAYQQHFGLRLDRLPGPGSTGPR